MNFMLASLFEWVFTASIMGSVLVLIIFATKKVLQNRLSPKWTYLLWMLLVLRLLLPWTPESSVSVFNLISVDRLPAFEAEQQQEAKQASSSASPVLTMPAAPSNEPTLQVAPQPTEASRLTSADYTGSQQGGISSISLMDVLPYIWLAGMAAVLAIVAYVNLRFSFSIRKEHASTDQRLQLLLQTCKEKLEIKRPVALVCTNRVTIATLSGIISPKLLLPPALVDKLTDDELEHLFLHELSHIKRGDIALNGLMNVLLAVHWFNPLLWYAYHSMREDQELACDAMALTRIPAEKTEAYGYTLIKLLEIAPRRAALSSTVNMTGSKKAIYKRIVMIKAFKRQTYKSTLLGLAVILVLSGCALTSSKVNVLESPEPVEANQNEQDDNQEQHEQVGQEEAEQELAEQIKQLATVWAEALKTRDGKPRYEMMSEQAKQKFEAEQIARSGEDWNFNIGSSSPWVVDYDIVLDGMTVTITYLTQTSQPATYNSQETVSFKLEHDELVVDDYTTAFEGRAVEQVPEQNEPDETGKISIFGTTPIAAYNEADVVTLSLNNQSYETAFHKAKFEPFGFYLPANMEERSLEDGNEWGYDLSRHHVTIGLYDTVVEDAELINEQLAIYKEYAGSEQRDQTIMDYFVFQHKGTNYLIRFLYWEEEQANALPLFLKFVETMRYVEQ
ncbi:hypothetical protein J40TS1_04140 [Paenibacillus montaniterrae]|uniref:Peptidase M56 domain-containing protein n=1 Tax=Paenibacillus montaniterrae TaxID=429341 RepID=A0A919YK42_9BACL|nr:M56 family metallopeptidase [Paenibacillus montaniterrae]GIP14772.1 hypothetical protein J40TS1_04140 [Paenibacillus montaniterrae]